MAAVTPTNLYITSVGSAKLSVAKFDAGVVYQLDNWASGIPDIISAMACYNNEVATSVGAIGVNWTATSGTIHITAATNTAMTLWVLSGLGQDVWNKPST